MAFQIPKEQDYRRACQCKLCSVLYCTEMRSTGPPCGLCSGSVSEGMILVQPRTEATMPNCQCKPLVRWFKVFVGCHMELVISPSNGKAFRTITSTTSSSHLSGRTSMQWTRLPGCMHACMHDACHVFFHRLVYPWCMGYSGQGACVACVTVRGHYLLSIPHGCTESIPEIFFYFKKKVSHRV